MAKRVDLKYVSQWGHPKAKIFERQAELIRYLDKQPADTPLRGFSLEADESLVDRQKRGVDANGISLFEDPAVNRANTIIPQRRFFAAATYEDVYRYLYDEDDVDDDRDVELHLDGSVSVRKVEEVTTQALQLGSVYEIIREGLPCHIYFDIEVEYEKLDSAPADDMRMTYEDAAKAFDELEVPHKPYSQMPACPVACDLAFDPSRMTELLLAELDAALHEEYDIRIRKEMVVKLVSDYKHKFSAHYIIHLPDAAFRNNQHLGRFLTVFVQKLHEKAKDDPAIHRALFYHKLTDAVVAARNLTTASLKEAPLPKAVVDRAAKGHLNFERGVVSAIDLAVYTRNRTFRCMSASKLGKKSHLHLDEGDCEFPYFQDIDLFLASMVANVEPGVRLLEYGLDLAAKKTDAALPRAIGTGFDGGGGGGGPFISKSGASPFPPLDDFIAKLVRARPYANGGILKWMQYETAMLYVIRGTRYCHNVGREHQSNGIYLVVSFPRGSVRQKCYDPDCGSAASPEVPIDAVSTACIAEYFRKLNEQRWGTSASPNDTGGEGNATPRTGTQEPPRAYPKPVPFDPNAVRPPPPTPMAATATSPAGPSNDGSQPPTPAARPVPFDPNTLRPLPAWVPAAFAAGGALVAPGVAGPPIRPPPPPPHCMPCGPVGGPLPRPEASGFAATPVTPPRPPPSPPPPSRPVPFDPTAVRPQPQSAPVAGGYSGAGPLPTPRHPHPLSAQMNVGHAPVNGTAPPAMPFTGPRVSMAQGPLCQQQGGPAPVAAKPVPFVARAGGDDRNGAAAVPVPVTASTPRAGPAPTGVEPPGVSGSTVPTPFEAGNGHTGVDARGAIRSMAGVVVAAGAGDGNGGDASLRRASLGAGSSPQQQQQQQPMKPMPLLPCPVVRPLRPVPFEPCKAPPPPPQRMNHSGPAPPDSSAQRQPASGTAAGVRGTTPTPTGALPSPARVGETRPVQPAAPPAAMNTPQQQPQHLHNRSGGHATAAPAPLPGAMGYAAGLFSSLLPTGTPPQPAVTAPVRAAAAPGVGADVAGQGRPLSAAPTAGPAAATPRVASVLSPTKRGSDGAEGPAPAPAAAPSPAAIGYAASLLASLLPTEMVAARSPEKPAVPPGQTQLQLRPRPQSVPRAPPAAAVPKPVPFVPRPTVGSVNGGALAPAPAPAPAAAPSTPSSVPPAMPPRGTPPAVALEAVSAAAVVANVRTPAVVDLTAGGDGGDRVLARGATPPPPRVAVVNLTQGQAARPHTWDVRGGVKKAPAPSMRTPPATPVERSPVRGGRTPPKARGPASAPADDSDAYTPWRLIMRYSSGDAGAGAAATPAAAGAPAATAACGGGGGGGGAARAAPALPASHPASPFYIPRGHDGVVAATACVGVPLAASMRPAAAAAATSRVCNVDTARNLLKAGNEGRGSDSPRTAGVKRPRDPADAVSPTPQPAPKVRFKISRPVRQEGDED